MKGYSIIPDRIENTGIISGIDILVDSKGSNGLLKVTGGDISIKLGENAVQTFPLKDGETFEFCGKIYLRHVSGSPFVSCLYYHTI